MREPLSWPAFSGRTLRSCWEEVGGRTGAQEDSHFSKADPHLFLLSVRCLHRPRVPQITGSSQSFQSVKLLLQGRVCLSALKAEDNDWRAKCSLNTVFSLDQKYNVKRCPHFQCLGLCVVGTETGCLLHDRHGTVGIKSGTSPPVCNPLPRFYCYISPVPLFAPVGLYFNNYFLLWAYFIKILGGSGDRNVHSAHHL